LLVLCRDSKCRGTVAAGRVIRYALAMRLSNDAYGTYRAVSYRSAFNRNHQNDLKRAGVSAAKPGRSESKSDFQRSLAYT
jgi:hypothetical protein